MRLALALPLVPPAAPSPRLLPRRFERALVYYEYAFPEDDATQAELDAIRFDCLVATARCELAVRLWRDALNHCHQALQIRPASADALHARAVALRALDE